MIRREHIWGIMPAAGVGSRMESDVPKQYLKLAGRTVIEHSIDLALSVENLQTLTVCLSPDDQFFYSCVSQHPRINTIEGGLTRADSVLNGLKSLVGFAQDTDWVIVHDAARPCLPKAILKSFIDRVIADGSGGIMAIQSKDTLKQSVGYEEHLEVDSTIDRSKIWQAQTPQMFRFAALKESLERCRAAAFEVTDEASALELAGHSVKLYQGSSQNIKITTPEDKDIAEFFLSREQ